MPPHVITSYSIHYTKLYEPPSFLPWIWMSLGHLSSSDGTWSASSACTTDSPATRDSPAGTGASASKRQRAEKVRLQPGQASSYNFV